MTVSKGVQPTLFCFTTSVLSVNTSLNRPRTFFFLPRKGQTHRICLNFLEGAVPELAACCLWGCSQLLLQTQLPIGELRAAPQNTGRRAEYQQCQKPLFLHCKGFACCLNGFFPVLQAPGAAHSPVHLSVSRGHLHIASWQEFPLTARICQQPNTLNSGRYRCRY